MRLIDADALKQQIRQKIDPHNFSAVIAAGAFFGEVDKSLTVDAVPVVRCKDCVFWLRDEGHGSNGECECGCNDGWWLPEDYCSCGERREKDETD